MKSKILLLLVATAAAALAAALGQGDGANADQRDDEIMPRDENPHTVWITKVMTIPRASLAALASMASLLPTTSSSVVVQTAFVYETIWSDPALSAWVTLKGGTKLPPTYSTSTSYSTITVIAHSVTYTTTTLHVRALETAGASSPDTGDLPPYSSVITAVGSPLWTSSRTAEPLPPPMLSAPVSSTITTVCDLFTLPFPPSQDGAVYTLTYVSFWAGCGNNKQSPSSITLSQSRFFSSYANIYDGSYFPFTATRQSNHHPCLSRATPQTQRP